MDQITRRTMFGSLGAAGVATIVASCAGPESDAAASQPPRRPTIVHLWHSAADFDGGSHDGTTTDGDGHIIIDETTDSVEFTDPHTDITRDYDVATWTSATTDLPFAATRLIPSWNTTTPSGTWIQVDLQAGTDAGDDTAWFVFGRWARHDGGNDIQRGTVNDQEDTYAAVHTDLLAAKSGHTFTGYRLRVQLYRLAGSDLTPALSLLTSMASALPADETVPVSEPGDAAGTVLDVPTYSQHLHAGHYPQWNGGGQAWCSPTCTAMVLDYWGLGPDESETGWVDIEDEERPQVDHVTRYVFDYSYGGAGNWVYNAAYAAERGARAYITQLRSLVEAEEFIKAGVPLILSASFSAEELDGAGYGTNGHLLTLVGFDDDGDPVFNDPASRDEADDDKVRITYRREQFENVWLPRSGGVAYVIAPPDHDLPAVLDADEPNWA